MNVLKKHWKIWTADKIGPYSISGAVGSALTYFIIDPKHYGISVAIAGAGLTGAFVSYLDKKRIYNVIKKEILQIDLKSSNSIHNSWFDESNPALEKLVWLACCELEEEWIPNHPIDKKRENDEEYLQSLDFGRDYLDLFYDSKSKAKNGFFSMG